MHVTDRIFIFLISSVLFLPSLAFSGPENFTYQGQIIKPNGQALEASNVDFRIELISPGAEECILYREEHTLNMSNSNGIFAIEVGLGTQSGAQYQDTTNLATALSNSTGTVNPDLCVMGGSYAPSPNDGRRLRITFNDGSGPVTLAQDHNIVSVPYATNASSISGLGVGDFIQVNSGPGFNLSQTNMEIVFNDSNWTELQALLDGTSTSFTAGAPTADVDNNNQKIVNLADPNPATDSDAVNVGYARSYIGGQQVDTADLGALGAGQNGEVLTWDGTQWNSQVINDVNKLPLGGGTMTGSINMGNQDISNTNDISANNNISATNNLSAGQDASIGNNLTVSGGIGVTNGINSAGNINLENESELQLAEATGNGSDYVSLKSPAALATPVNLILPDNDGDPGQYLQTDGSGVLSWQDVNAGVTQVFGRTGNVVATAGDYDADLITFDNTYGGDVDTATEVQGAIEELSTEKLAKSGDSMTGNLVMDLNGGVTTELRFQDTGTKYVGFQAPNTVNAVSSFVWTLPDDDGGAGQVLQTNGAGVLSWTSVAAESRSVTAGQGLTGGGDLSFDRTFDIGAGNGITVNADDIEVRAGTGISVDGTGVNVDVAGTADKLTSAVAADSLLIRDSEDAGNLKEITRSNFVLSQSEVGTFASNEGFLQNITGTELDNVFSTNGLLVRTGANTYTTVTNNSTDWDTAFSWGDHSAAGYLTAETQSLDDAYDNGSSVTVDSTDVVWNLTGTNNFQVQDNGTTSFIVDDNGNVGVGTTAPSSLLDIASAFPVFTLTDTDLNRRFRISHDSTVSTISNSTGTTATINISPTGGGGSLHNVGIFRDSNTSGSANFMIYRANGSNDVNHLLGKSDSYLAAFGGNVGIGSSSPLFKLDVDGDVRVQSGEIIGGGPGGINFRKSDSASDKLNLTDTTLTSISGDLNLATDTFGTALTVGRTSGSVGIGTTTPTSQLQVAGGVQIGDDLALCDGTKAGTLKYSGSSVSYCDGASWEAFGTAAGGEVNDGANVGTGEGVFKAKNGLNLEFKSIGSANGKIAVSSDTDNVTLTIDESAFDPTAIPVGTTPLTATTLQAALVELEAAKVSTTRSIASGAGLTGGGDLTSDRTLAVGAGNGINVNADDIEVVGGDAITVDGTGVNVDITNETAESTVAPGDELLIFDTSAGGLRKMTRDNFVRSASEINSLLSSSGYIMDGGNTEAAAVTIGTNDSFALNFETNNSTAMTILNNGNVGIGTTVPSGEFHLSGNGTDAFLESYGANGVGLHLLSTDTGGRDYELFSSGSGNSVGAGKFTLFDGTAGEVRLLMDETGNIGIGTTTPTQRLEVAGAMRIQPSTLPGTPDAGVLAVDTSDSNKLKFYDGSTWIEASGGTDFLPLAGGQMTGDINLANQYINGTGSTTYGLNFSNSNNAEFRGQSGGGYGITIDNTSGGGSSFRFLQFEYSGNTMGQIAVANEGSASNTAMRFVTRSAGSTSEKMRIASSGYLGIGTTAPERLLHVDGAMRITPAALPGTGAAGDLAIDSADFNKLKYYDGSSWVEAGGSGGGGDILNGGNSLSAPVTVGTNDAQDLNLETNNTTAINIDSTQNINFEGNAYLYDFLYGSNSGNYLRMGNSSGVGGATLFSANDYVELRTNNTADVRFTTNNTERMRVTSNGNVGIGTTNPDQLLTISDVNPTFRFDRSGANFDVELAASGGGDFTISGGADGTGGALTEYFRIRGGSGAVGIGTSAPVVELDVHTGRINAAEICDEDNSNCIDLSDGISGGSLWTDNAGDISYTSGNVGIGTSAPGSAFEIVTSNSTDLMTIQSTNNFGWSSIDFMASNNAHAGWVGYGNASAPSQTGQMYIEASGTGEIAFWNDNTQRMVIDGSGNVGIGTTSPGDILDVAGNIRAQQLCDETGANCKDISTGWASGGDFLADGSVPMTGALQAVGGSAGAPGLTFDGDEDTGFFNSADGVIRYSSNGTQRWVFSSSDFYSANVTGAYLRYNGSSSASTPLYTIRTDTDTGLYMSAADTVGLATGGVGRLQIDSSGRVGIGTTAPREALDVHGKLTIGDSAGGDAGIAYFSRGSDGNETVKLGYLNASEDNEFQFYHSGGDGYFSWYTNDSAVEEQMRLDNQGRLGIGTSAPDKKLHVYADGEVAVIAERAGAGSNVLQLRTTNPSGVGANGSGNQLQFAAETATEGVVESLGNFRFVMTDATAGSIDSAVSIVNYDNGAPQIPFSINSTGEVGIGTTSPVGKLDVAGQVRSVNSSGSSEVNTTATVDWDNGNAQTMNVDCDTTTFSNMLDGGTYILAVSETGTSQCDFSQTGLTFFFSPANGPRESGTRTVYTFQRIGSDVYVSWIKGFQ